MAESGKSIGEAVIRPKLWGLDYLCYAKQTQFEGAKVNVSVFVTKDYQNTAALGPRENKANQSQMPAFGRKLKGLSSKGK